MKIIIIGAGKVGKLIIGQLIQDGHEIVAIDRDESRLLTVQNKMDVLCICGNGVTKEVLREADVAHCDLLIAVTGEDEENLLACLAARKLGARHTIARVRKPEYASQLELFSEDMGLSMTINPELSTANEIFSSLRFPELITTESFAKGRFELAELQITRECEATSMPLHRLSEKYRTRALVCAVRRDERTIIPNGDFCLKTGDRVCFAAEPRQAARFLPLVGISRDLPSSVMIIGAGKITYYLVELLQTLGIRSVIIESDLQAARAFGERFPKALVIHADGTNRDVLREEGIGTVDAFVSLTSTDEINVLLSLFATGEKVPKVMTKISRMETLDLLLTENVGRILSPPHVSARAVTGYVRALNAASEDSVEAAYSIMDETVQAVEFVVRESDAALTDMPLRSLRIREGILICCLIRGGDVMIPGGNDVILPQDHVVVVTANIRLQDLSDILEQR